MNPGVALVRSYLQLNGYFTVSQLPVIRKRKDGLYQEITDVDLLALRFPRARHLVSEGRPGPADDLTFAHDPELGLLHLLKKLEAGEEDGR